MIFRERSKIRVFLKKLRVFKVQVQKPNSCTYNLFEVSGHNLDSSQILGFRIQCLNIHTNQFQTAFSQGIRGGGEYNPLL